MGNAAGLTQFGVNRAVLPRGGCAALRHWYGAEDEFVIVVSGEVVLRDNEGKTLLWAGDCAARLSCRRALTCTRHASLV